MVKSLHGFNSHYQQRLIDQSGLLAHITKDKHVLVTKAGGGYLTKTPSYDSENFNNNEETALLRNINISFDRSVFFSTNILDQSSHLSHE